jgi:hypothetical protein
MIIFKEFDDLHMAEDEAEMYFGPEESKSDPHVFYGWYSGDPKCTEEHPDCDEAIREYSTYRDGDGSNGRRTNYEPGYCRRPQQTSFGSRKRRSTDGFWCNNLKCLEGHRN